MITLCVVLSSASASADMRQDCAQEDDPAKRVEGCTAALASGKWQGKQLIWALNNRGLAYVAEGALDKALDDYDRALEIDPDHAAVLDNRGNAHAIMGNFDKALADHDRAITLEPNNPATYNNRAADYMDMRELDSALPDLDRAIAMAPDYGDAFKNRAQVRCVMGMIDGAVADWKQALETGRVSAAALQLDMKRAGHYEGEVDGAFGTASNVALVAWVADGCQ